jgi:regulator of sirC expression with transglutaminase-like and TPR domain
MKWLSGFLLLLFLVTPAFSATPSVSDKTTLAEKVELLFAPDRDLADVKLTLDAMVDPSTDVDATRRAIDDLSSSLKLLEVDAHTSLEKLAVLKRFYYESGPWNNNQPFAYDMADPLGKNPANRLMAKYILSRQGNCVTMPILFMILGQRIGLDMTLAEAPLHLFVKFKDDAGRELNLETTSGAGFTRDVWYRKSLPMTDKAVSSGIYLKALSRDQVVAVMATSLVERCLRSNQPEDAITVAQVILRHHPDSALTLVKRGSAYYQILQRDIISRYSSVEEMPPEIRAYADGLYQQNQADFAQAEAMGWTERDGINDGE